VHLKRRKREEGGEFLDGRRSRNLIIKFFAVWRVAGALGHHLKYIKTFERSFKCAASSLIISTQ
jgi:hypothetical protein